MIFTVYNQYKRMIRIKFIFMLDQSTSFTDNPVLSAASVRSLAIKLVPEPGFYGKESG